MRLSSLQGWLGTTSNSDDQKLAEAEKKARAAKRGLWADPESMPPWKWQRLGRDKKAKAAMSYWLSTNSNKRHNSECRWYEKSKGRACTASEGVACKICGG
jgi:hypothetical protein